MSMSIYMIYKVRKESVNILKKFRYDFAKNLQLFTDKLLEINKEINPLIF